MPFAVVGGVLGISGAAAAGIAAAGIGAYGAISAADSNANAADNATAAQSRIADGQTQLGRDQLGFNKQVYSDGADARSSALDLSKRVGAAQLQGMQFATETAKDYDAYNKGTFRPLEQKVVGEAQGYDTPERRLQAAAAAQGDVDQSFAATQAASERDLARDGIAPGSGKAMSLMQDAMVSQAAARAGAGTTAVRNVEQQGFSRSMDAASLGRNLPSNQAVQEHVGTLAGTAATTAGMQGINAQQSGVGNVNAGYAGANSAGNSAGNLFGSVASLNNTAAAQTSAGFNQLGQAVGSLSKNPAATNWMSGLFSSPAAMPSQVDDLGIGMSDKNIKTGTGKPASGKKALAQIAATPVEAGWKYDPAKGGPDDGGQPHTGPMAQTVRRTMGESLAPGGTKIDLVGMNGKLMAGMQELTKRVKKLETSKG